MSVLDKKGMERESERILAPLRIRMDKKSLRTKVKFLSGGQRSSVAIGKVISSRARVIIMDEPTAALGVKESRQFLEVARELKRQGISLIFISHRMQDVFSVIDRIMILRGGRRVACKEIDKTSVSEVVSFMVGGELVDTPSK